MIILEIGEIKKAVSIDMDNQKKAALTVRDALKEAGIIATVIVQSEPKVLE